jgi:hypothetical protein
MGKKARASAPAIAAVQSAAHFPIVKWPRMAKLPNPDFCHT